MNLTTFALGLLCTLQFIILIFILFWIRQKRLHHKSLDPLLQKTKKQLQREIARHETTEELLFDTQNHLQCLLNSQPTVIIGITEEGLVTHWNTAAEMLTGLPSFNALGKNVTEVFPNFPISQDRLIQAIRRREPILQDAYFLPDQQDVRHLELSVQPLISPDTKGAVILSQDITLKTRMERNLIHNEKMLSLGVMAAGLAHEINNPLAAIISNLHTIHRRLSPAMSANLDLADELKLPFSQLTLYLEKREIPKFLEGIQQASERAAKIVKTMLDFSHTQNTKFEFCNLIQLMNESLELATHTFELKSSGSTHMPFIIRDFDPQIPLVECVSSELQQVFLNLLLNAAQAIEMAAPSIQNPSISIKLAKDKLNALITIQDNGPGMSDSLQKRIFEPFFTTKDVGIGTGLGLSVSYYIITQHHHGHVDVRSQLGQGTQFNIRIPLRHGVPVNANP